ncbi:MAG: rRNA maturation RNase YbeY [Acidimicrobiia bacterium]|nr:rRNA maturation RNase YbeY [Acidimicrobiia bacterium]NNC74971.1 rRNA maturation RNase YbeY [Acidimicrobiia bacterium]
MSLTLSDSQDRTVDSEIISTVAGVVVDEEGLPPDTELSVALIDTSAMAQLNEAHMGKDGATDVLAFPLEAAKPGRPPTSTPGGPPIAIGDVFICPDVVAANAAAAGVPFDDEVALMVVHGILHLLGYDHVDDEDAALMEGRETDLLALTGRTRP